jgi:predicted dehydrogenase
LEKKYNVAIVGCGRISQVHLGVLKKLNSVETVAVCDSDEKKAVATSREWKTNHYSDFTKMLNNEDISILSILTPPSSHAFLAIEAIKQGINVLIEKPLTMTTKEAKLIIDSLKGRKSKMTVVYHWLFSKAMLKSLPLDKKEVGEIFNVNVEALHAWKNDPMTSDPNHWSHRLLGGRFGEMLPHPVYILQSILGNDLETNKIFVSKRGNIKWMLNDELYVILQSKKGLGSIYVSFNSPRSTIKIDVFGAKKVLRIDLVRQTVIRNGPRTISKFSIAKDSLAVACRLLLSTIVNSLEFSFRGHGEYAISNVYTNFIDSITKDVDPLVTPEMAYNNVRIVEEICNGIAKRDDITKKTNNLE